MSSVTRSTNRSADAEQLYSLARQGIFERSLPISQPCNQTGTAGSEQPCSMCHQPIGAGEIEYKAQCGSNETLRFHVHCYLAWQDVRRSIRRR